MKTQTAVYVLDELTIKLADAAGAVVESVIAQNVGVTVDFDFTPANECDDAQVSVRAVKVAGCALEVGDEGKATLNLWMGFDVLMYLSNTDVDLIAEELIDRHEKAVKAQRAEARIDAATFARGGL